MRELPPYPVDLRWCIADKDGDGQGKTEAEKSKSPLAGPPPIGIDEKRQRCLSQHATHHRQEHCQTGEKRKLLRWKTIGSPASLTPENPLQNRPRSKSAPDRQASVFPRYRTGKIPDWRETAQHTKANARRIGRAAHPTAPATKNRDRNKAPTGRPTCHRQWQSPASDPRP